jgi:OOP family OmpA-OmpF porin
MRIRAITTALLLATAPCAAAQSAGTFEFGAFGRYAVFDNDLHYDDEFGGGGTLGIFLLRNVAIEGEASYLKTQGVGISKISNIPLRGRLVFNVPLGGFASALRLGGGYVYDIYGKDIDFKSHGITALAGFRVGLTEHWAFQFDGTMDYVPSPKQPGLDNYTNFGIQGGLTLLFGNSYDRDKDGVKDSADRCPDTPRGESVDASGCSASQRDSDGDRVMDDRDKCPNTPAGEQVDANGCSPSQLDADRDGVADTADKCPNTPAGEPVDASGCSDSQRDDDRDGVMNPADKCPNTPAGEKVDANGCAPSQLDADGDGVPDAQDNCPDTPKGTPVDARGCPRDSDADGVPDGVDQCPNTPNGQAVDEKGCPILFKPGERKVILQGVNFEVNKATLTPESEGILKDVAHSLAENPSVRVQVAGFTDISGSRALNMRLSQARAETVAKFLEANGVSPAQVAGAKGYGPAQPVASNKTPEGRAKNRRVELRRVGG